MYESLSRGAAAQRIGAESKNVMREARPWLLWLGRFGYVAKGVVYTLVGVLAVQAAIGAGGETTDSRGALRHIAQASFGEFLLILIGIGLVGYALWRVIQAILDTERKGSNAKGVFVRLGYVVIAVIHAAIAWSAFTLVFGDHDGGMGSAQTWTAELMSQPFGSWLVVAVGAIVVMHGARQLYRAYSLSFRNKLKLEEMTFEEEKWATHLGRMGYAARGVVFGICGVFLVIAAIHSDPQQARGLDGALQTLAQQRWGGIVLGVVALGLLAYGIFLFFEARYRRMVIV
jgi:hypothetical protein